MKEFSRLWRSDEVSGIEMLSASFKKFEFTKHWHEELAVGIILSGAEGLDYRGEKLTIPQGQIIAINPAEPHTGFAASEQGWNYRMFYFDTQMITNVLEVSELPGLTYPTIANPVLDDPLLFQYLLDLHLALEGQALKLSQQSLLQISLEALFSRHGVLKESQDTPAGEVKLLVVRDYLHDNWRNDTSLDELESVCGLTKFKLIRSFKQAFGMTPHQYFIHLKLHGAKKLIAAGASLTDAALESGFVDQSHMHRNFKKAFGATPGRYRRAG